MNQRLKEEREELAEKVKKETDERRAVREAQKAEDDAKRVAFTVSMVRESWGSITGDLRGGFIKIYGLIPTLRLPLSERNPQNAE